MTGLAAAKHKMRVEGLPEAAVASFERLYGQLATGRRGLLASDELEPVLDVPALEDLDDEPAPLDGLAIIKLNGGLGTSMGLSTPKGLVAVRPPLTFLDVIARQIRAARSRHGARLPLVLMHSFATRVPSLAFLERYADLPSDVPLDFLQGREPKLRADDLSPVQWPRDPRLEWCPPGHGDLYTAIATSGMLGALLERGYRYAFMSNADNLGAVVEPRIVAWMARHGVPFLMEVVAGTAADRKGGHIAWRDGCLVLRETAQTPPDDAGSFGDFRRWRHYNTNNLWLDLVALSELLEERDGVLGLPLIANRKTVDPTDAGSPAVVQLETAMGAALGVIPGARVLAVPRRRFVPVKTTDDLLVVRSDACELHPEDARLEPGRRWPLVALDPAYFRRLDDFERRFPAGAPSLARCEGLVIRGDVSFGRDVTVVGEVELDGPLEVADGTILDRSIELPPSTEERLDMSAVEDDVQAAREALYSAGIVGCKGAYSRDWARQLGEDIAVLFEEALAQPNGALGRGPNRYYVEITPERLRGFEELVTHPWFTGVCEAVLGPDYEVIEVGFDVPGPGAMNQPWHRDFPAPEDTVRDRKLTSLAFNVTTVDVEPDMGPFEIAPGTQWESGEDFEHGMFPPKSEAERYASIAEQKMPKMGDISARSALTVHRGTANQSQKSRPVLVVGVDAPNAGNAERHDLQFTESYYAALPEEARRHLPARIVEELEPIEQEHTIEGLVMGEA